MPTKLARAAVLLASLAAIPAIAACTTDRAPLVIEPGLSKTNTSQGDLYVKPDHNVGAYDLALFPPIEITNRPGRKGLSDRERAALSASLGQRLRDRTAAGGLTVASEPDACAMTMDFAIKDLQVDALMSEIRGGSNTTFISSMGAVTLEVVIRDSLTNTPLVQFSQRRRLPGGQLTGSGRAALISALEGTLDGIIVDFSSRLGEVIPRTTGDLADVGPCDHSILNAATAAEASRQSGGR